MSAKAGPPILDKRRARQRLLWAIVLNTELCHCRGRIDAVPSLRGMGAGSPMRRGLREIVLRAYTVKSPDASRPSYPARRRAASLVTSTTFWAPATGIR